MSDYLLLWTSLWQYKRYGKYTFAKNTSFQNSGSLFAKWFKRWIFHNCITHLVCKFQLCTYLCLSIVSSLSHHSAFALSAAKQQRIHISVYQDGVIVLQWNGLYLKKTYCLFLCIGNNIWAKLVCFFKWKKNNQLS